MARAVVLAYPTYGHIAPILPVVAELVRRGDEVVFYGTGRSRARIESTGALFRFYPRGHDDFNPTPPTDGLFSDMARLATLTEDILPQLIAEVRETAPTYLLFDTKSFWGRLTGQLLGIPAITLSVVFAIRDGVLPVPALTEMLYSGASTQRLIEGLLGLGRYFETANRLTVRYRSESPGIVGFLGNPQPLNIVFTCRELQPGSEAFGSDYVFVGTSIPPGTAGPDHFPFDKLDSRPLIYVSLGTTFNDAPEFYLTCFEGLASKGWQVVLSTGGASPDLGTAPENFIVCKFVPQLALLERASVFVTHGGMNSANEGLYFGVPLVVVPQRGDQFIVGSRVAALGAGVMLSPHEVSPAGLRTAVELILNRPDFREKAKCLQSSLRAAGGYLRAADAIQTRAAAGSS